MPKGSTRRVPNRQMRAAWAAQSHWNHQIAMANLTPDEYARYQVLLAEAGQPEALVDRAAILERARTHIAYESRHAGEPVKTAEQDRHELFG